MKFQLTMLCLLIFASSLASEEIISSTIITSTDKSIEAGHALEFELNTELIRDENRSINGSMSVLDLKYALEINESYILNINTELSYSHIRAEKAVGNLDFLEVGYSKKV